MVQLGVIAVAGLAGVLGIGYAANRLEGLTKWVVIGGVVYVGGKALKVI